MKHNIQTKHDEAAHLDFYRFYSYSGSPFFIPDEKKSILSNWGDFFQDTEKLNILSFSGKDRYLLENSAAFLAKKWGKFLAVIDLSNLAEKYFTNPNLLAEIRKCLIDKGSLYFITISDTEIIYKNENFNLLNEIFYWILSESHILFLSSDEKLPLFVNLDTFSWYELDFEKPSLQMQEKIWEHYLSEETLLIKTETLNHIIHFYKLYEGQIRDAVYLAGNNCLPFQDKKKDIFETELLKACEKISRHSLSDFAVLSPNATDDLTR